MTFVYNTSGAEYHNFVRVIFSIVGYTATTYEETVAAFVNVILLWSTKVNGNVLREYSFTGFLGNSTTQLKITFSSTRWASEVFGIKVNLVESSCLYFLPLELYFLDISVSSENFQPFNNLSVNSVNKGFNYLMLPNLSQTTHLLLNIALSSSSKCDEGSVDVSLNDVYIGAFFYV